MGTDFGGRPLRVGGILLIATFSSCLMHKMIQESDRMRIVEEALTQMDVFPQPTVTFFRYGQNFKM